MFAENIALRHLIRLMRRNDPIKINLKVYFLKDIFRKFIFKFIFWKFIFSNVYSLTCVVWNCIFQTCMFPKCNFWKYTLLSQWSWLNFALFVYFPLLKGRERGAQSKLMLPCFAQVLVKCGRLTSPPPLQLHDGWICSTFLHCVFAQMWPQIACIVTLQALLKFWRLIPSMRSFSSSSHCTLKEENELKAGTDCQMYRSSPQKLHLP